MSAMNIPGSTVNLIPNVLYKDANAGIEWLQSVLGFTEHVVYRNADGAVEHAELLFGNGMLMVGTYGLNKQSAGWYGTPSEAGGMVTSASYLIAKDCTPIWERAQAAGAEILLPLRVMDYGGQAFTLRDPEGHVWSLGEYDPWNVPAT
jgi:uncharacterized glyoxalase superfamily protein PhnB